MNRNESWGEDDEKGGWEIFPDERTPIALTTTTTTSDENTTAAEAAGQHRRIQSLSTATKSRSGRRPNNTSHRRNKTSFGDLFASIGNGLGTLAEDVQSEARLVRDVFSSELEDAGKGRKFFLDMTMSRNMSILPEQLTEVFEEATGMFTEDKEEKESDQPLLPSSMTAATEQQEQKKKGSGMLPYLSLLGAVISVSSTGPANALLHGVSPPLRFFWRATVTAMVFGVLAARVIMQRRHRHKQQTGGEEGGGLVSILSQITGSQWLNLFAATCCWTATTVLCVYAYSLTSIGNVVIGANSQAIILLLGKVLLGERLHWMEALGVMVAFSGCILCSTDEVKDPDQVDNGKLALYGDLMALGAGFTGVGYLTFAKMARTGLPVFLFMFIIMAGGSVLSLMFILLTQGDDVSLSRDPFTGLFGWMTVSENRAYILIYMAVFSHVVGSAGFVRAMEYFDNIVIAVGTLLEPITATLIAFTIGVGQLPGPMGWAGNLLVVFGTLGVVLPSVQKSKDNGGH